MIDIDLAGGEIMLVAAQTNWMVLLCMLSRGRSVEDLRRAVGGDHAARLGRAPGDDAAGPSSGRDWRPRRDAPPIQAGSGDAVLGSLASGSADAAMLGATGELVAERQGFPLLADLRDYQVPYGRRARRYARR